MKYVKKIMLLLCIVLLASSINTIQAHAASPAKYTLKKHKEYYKDKKGNIAAKYVFVEPKLEGKSNAVKKINADLNKMYQADCKINKKDLFDCAKVDCENNAGIFPKSSPSYLSTKNCKVTYNKNGIISFRYTGTWYAGGVCNGTHKGYTYSLKTGKRLTVDKVVSGSKSQVKKKIVNAYTKIYLKESDVHWEDAIEIVSNKKLKEFNFYISNGNVYVCFDVYELAIGARGPVQIKLKSNMLK